MKLKLRVGLGALALLAIAAPADACSLERYFWPWEETLARTRAAEELVRENEYDFVFLARVKTVKQRPVNEWDVTETIAFEVTGVLKGAVPKTLTALNEAKWSSCGIALAPPVGNLTLVMAAPIPGSSSVNPSLMATGDYARSILAAYARKGVKPKPP